MSPTAKKAASSSRPTSTSSETKTENKAEVPQSSSANTTTENNPTANVPPVTPDGREDEGNTNLNGPSVNVGTGPTAVIVEGTPVNQDTEPVKPKSELRNANFHYPTELDPMRQVPGTSNYLDRVQREQAEIDRAKVEGRKPDLKNPPAMQSTPLVEEQRLAQTNTIPVGKEPDVVAKVSHSVYPTSDSDKK